MVVVRGAQSGRAGRGRPPEQVLPQLPQGGVTRKLGTLSGRAQLQLTRMLLLVVAATGRRHMQPEGARGVTRLVVAVARRRGVRRIPWRCWLV